MNRWSRLDLVAFHISKASQGAKMNGIPNSEFDRILFSALRDKGLSDSTNVVTDLHTEPTECRFQVPEELVSGELRQIRAKILTTNAVLCWAWICIRYSPTF